MVNHHHRDSALVVLYSVRSFCFVFLILALCVLTLKKGGGGLLTPIKKTWTDILVAEQHFLQGRS